MYFLKFPILRFMLDDELKHYESFDYQIDDENPILLARFIDCVRWGSIYPIAYNFEHEEFLGIFIPQWWDKLRWWKTEKIIFDERGLSDNLMVKDTSFKPCKLSELKVGL